MLPYPGNTELVTSYGLMLLLALVVCWFLARRLAPAFGFDRSHVDLAVPLIFILSSIGARVLSAVISDPEATGLGFHGTHVRFRLFGLLMFAAPLTLAYARLAGISFRRFVDLFALPAVAWLMVLRIGCLMAGCCWGDVALVPLPSGNALPPQVLTFAWLAGDWIPAVSFPPGSYAYEQHLELGLIHAGAESSLPVHPTQLYEPVLLLPLAVMIARYSRSEHEPGSVALMSLAAYAVLRFMLEFVRADSAPLVAELTTTQLICIGVLLMSYPTRRILERSVSQV